MIGKTNEELCFGEHARAYVLVHQRVRQTGQSQFVEVQIQQKDGLHTRVSVQFPLELQDGLPRSICGIPTDMTRRKIDERALSESKLRLAHAHRIVKLSHWLWDEINNQLTYFSDDLAGIFGVSREAVPTTSEAWAAFIHPDDRDATLSVIHEAIQRKIGYETEYRVVRGDGSVL